MNLTLLLSVALAWSLSVGAAGLYGMKLGKDSKEAAAAREERLVREATDKTLTLTAEAIAKIEVKHVTVTQKLQKEVFSREVFRECVSGPEPVRLFNSTIGEGTATRTSVDSILPPADTTGK